MGISRYGSYGQGDSVPLTEDDTFLLGVDMYQNMSNLPEGICQAATNSDFTQSQAVSRGGFVCLPALGATPFNNAWLASTSNINDTWNGVCFGNSIFVGVSSNSGGFQVVTSSNGTSWMGQTAANTNQWNAVCNGAGLFVAVAKSGAGNRVMTSNDGKTWTARTSASDLVWTSVVYGNGIFVAVASDNVTAHVMTSPDGITWTARNGPSAFGKNAVTFGNGVFVAVGNNNSSYSSDGITWVAGSIGADIWVSVTFGNGKFVAITTNTTAQPVTYSTDGITWTYVTTSNLGIAASRKQVTFGNGTFVAINANQSFFSTDALVWVTLQIANGASWDCIAYGANNFVTLSLVSSSTSAAYLPTVRVFASGRYSDPNATSIPWIVLAGATNAGFFSFGQTQRSISYPAGYTLSAQATIVQANNFLFIFGGSQQYPIYWNGMWGQNFIAVPGQTLGAGYENIPYSNQGTYYQNRLWVIQGKDTIAASQNLDFQNFNLLTSVFNINVGTSDYLVCSYPFGNNSLVVFENRSVYLLQAVNSAALASVTSTEITRQQGIIGINAVTAVGPDLVYFTSDRNITSIRLNIQNATQAITVPLSQNINPIMRRVNWSYGYKISLGYWNNLLYVALPLDNSTVCNTVLVYNFITNQWYGEWNFDSSINMQIQGWITSNYLGLIRMHCITEDGRIFVVGEGQNDISGANVAEVSFSLTTRGYCVDNNNRFNRRMYGDFATNRPNFSVRGYVDGVSEFSDILSNQTYLRSDSWRYPSPPYSMDNSSDDFNQAYRKDYATGPNSIQCGSGFLPEVMQEYRFPIIFRRNGRVAWFRVTNTTGKILINGIGTEARGGIRSNIVEVG